MPRCCRTCAAARHGTAPWLPDRTRPVRIRCPAASRPHADCGRNAAPSARRWHGRNGGSARWRRRTAGGCRARRARRPGRRAACPDRPGSATPAAPRSACRAPPQCDGARPRRWRGPATRSRTGPGAAPCGSTRTRRSAPRARVPPASASGRAPTAPPATAPDTRPRPTATARHPHSAWPARGHRALPRSGRIRRRTPARSRAAGTRRAMT